VAWLVKKLDRALCNVEWKYKFPISFVINKPIIGSDHSPILLKEGPDKIRKRRGFRFEIGWMKEPSYGHQVNGNW
ncbi:hypothetical protein LINPERPRIM_LOCUS37476, partial [Linum perenne]